MEQITAIENILKEKMLATQAFEYRSDGTYTLSMAMYLLSNEFIKKPSRRAFALCMPISASTEKAKTLRLTESVPTKIGIKLNKTNKRHFYLEPVQMKTENAKGERIVHDTCITRIPTSGNKMTCRIASDYETVVKSLAKDLYFAFAESKLEGYDKMSRMQQFNKNAEVNADIKNFLNSFDAFEVVYHDVMPQIFSYRGFERFGIQDGVEYVHLSTHFYRLPTNSLFDMEVKNKVEEKIANRKSELSSDENQ